MAGFSYFLLHSSSSAFNLGSLGLGLSAEIRLPDLSMRI
jgi:hypothetical protein